MTNPLFNLFFSFLICKMTAVCPNRCNNGGNCTSPNNCSCAHGWEGPTTGCNTRMKIWPYFKFRDKLHKIEQSWYCSVPKFNFLYLISGFNKQSALWDVMEVRVSNRECAFAPQDGLATQLAVLYVC